MTVPEGPNKYARFQKFNKHSYEQVNDTLKLRTHLTAREWAIARLCADFKTDGKVPMTWIGERLPELVPFMDGRYGRQDVSSAEAAFKRKVMRSGTTFFYAYYAGLISLEEMLEIIQEVIRNIEALKKIEGADQSGDEAGDVNLEVQQMMAETLRRITEKLSDVNVSENSFE